MDKVQDKIFVTGGAGLVGKELIAQLLDQGYHVRAMYHHKQIDLNHPLLEIIQGDLLDVVFLEDALRGIDYVYHCAALVSYDPADRFKLMKMNIEGTANVVNACLGSSVKKLIHVSSVAAIGRSEPGELVNETMQWTEETSRSNYSKSKFYAELEVWRGIGEGLDAVIVNPSLILGGDDWSTGSSAIFKSAYEEFPWYSSGSGGFVDVKDVARAMILLMNSDITAQRFLLNGENLTFKEVFTRIAGCFGKKPPHKKVNAFLASLVWRWEALKGWITGRSPLLTRETAMSAQSKVFYDHTKILKTLPGFSFTPIDETIARTCAVLKEKYNLP